MSRVLVDRLRLTVAAATARPDDAIAVGYADVREVLSALDAAEAECARLRGELVAVRSAVRMLDGARAAIDAHGQRVLRSLAGEERAALLEELAAARRERDDWNASATSMEAERDRLLTASLEAVANERARCAAACREVAARYRHGACGCEECGGRGDGARECAEAIERGEVGR